MTRRKAYSKPKEFLGALPASRDEVNLRWVSDGWLWGPICPQDEMHGGMIDLQGTTKWYCRHHAHIGRGVYTEDQLIDMEFARVTSAARTQEILQGQLEEPLP